MSATLTSELVWRVSALLHTALLAVSGGLCICALLSGSSWAADANPDDEPGLLGQFYSYLPAAPQLKLLSINFNAPWADDMDKARKAYKNGNYDKARKNFEKAAEQGNIVAAWYLGQMYRLGRGVPRDPERAFQYYSQVAGAFNPDESDDDRLRVMVDSLVHVGDFYRTGEPSAGIEPNPRKAYGIYSTAASYGHPGAQYALGVMNLRGQAVQKNVEGAMRWLVLSARKRYAPAEALLGDLYWEGVSVPQNRTRAIMWYILAQRTARPEENPEIFDRYDAMLAGASEEERLEAEARAAVWAEKYPVERASAAAPEEQTAPSPEE